MLSSESDEPADFIVDEAFKVEAVVDRKRTRQEQEEHEEFFALSMEQQIRNMATGIGVQPSLLGKYDVKYDGKVKKLEAQGDRIQSIGELMSLLKDQDMERLHQTITECMTVDQLRALNKVVCTKINKEQRQKVQQQMVNFKVGENVSFKGKQGQHITGTIVSLNKKSVSLKNCSDGSHGWRVNPGHLKKIQ